MKLRGLSALVLFTAGMTVAQYHAAPIPGYNSKLFTVRGELKIEGEGRPQDYTAEIESCKSFMWHEKTSIPASGLFAFTVAVSDCYVVRILAGQQGKVVQEKTMQVGLDPSAVRFVLRLEDRPQPASGYVSLHQLASPPPKKAVKAFDREGMMQQAAEQYRQAIQIDPGYAQAHQELGSLYLRQGQLEAARAELDAARRLGLESPEVLGSLALALLQLDRPKESESAAREALAKDPANATANYALGYALLFHSTDYPVILDHLARAAEQIPSARLLAAKVRTKSGDINGAIQDLTEYLRVCPEDKRASAEATRRELQVRLASVRR
jgi:thioredoxin-like negative regulator of GroEL